MIGVNFFKTVLVKNVLQSFKGRSMNVVDFTIGPYANRVQIVFGHYRPGKIVFCSHSMYFQEDTIGFMPFMDSVPFF